MNKLPNTSTDQHIVCPSDLSPGALSRRKFLQLAGLSGIGLTAQVMLSGCGGTGAIDTVGELRQLLVAHWQNRYPGKDGGLSLQMLTPSGDYFASTLDGVAAGHHFRGASTTKTFTSAAIMLLDQRGLLRIDDPVAASMPGRSDTYLPDTPAYAIPYRSQITIRQLLQHRAGIFDITNQTIPLTSNALYAGQRYVDWQWEQDSRHSFTKDELAGVLAVNQLSNFAPGTTFRYSDSGYMLLGKIVEQVSGLPLDVFKTRELLQPNGLTQTHFVTDGAEWALPLPFIDGFSLSGGVLTPATEYNYSYDPGSGNLITTPADLARWIRRLLRGEAGVSATQVARMCELLPPNSYGLGITRRVVAGLDLGLGHNGGTGGYLTDAYYDPKTDVGFVLQSSLIDSDDLLGQFQWLGAIEVDARNVLGF
jgi:D-alanyl-D-alanine carboxypeptidase